MVVVASADTGAAPSELVHRFPSRLCSSTRSNRFRNRGQVTRRIARSSGRSLHQSDWIDEGIVASRSGLPAGSDRFGCSTMLLIRGYLRPPDGIGIAGGRGTGGAARSHRMFRPPRGPPPHGATRRLFTKSDRPARHRRRSAHSHRPAAPRLRARWSAPATQCREGPAARDRHASPHQVLPRLSGAVDRV